MKMVYYTEISSITAMMSGAMCPEQLLIDCKKYMNCNVFVGYGSTECSPLITQANGYSFLAFNKISVVSEQVSVATL